MSLPTITISDFVGDIRLSANRFDEEDIDSYIETYKTRIMVDLLGANVVKEIQLNNYFKYEFILSGGLYTYYDCNYEVQSGYLDSFNKIIKTMIYFYIVRDDFKMTDTGAVNNLNENSIKVNHNKIATDRYNKCVGYYQEFIEFVNIFDKVEYKNFTLVDNLDNTYSITYELDIQSFNEIGDYIYLNDTIKYKITNKSGNDDEETLTILADSVGLSFDYFYTKPYSKIVIDKNFKYIFQ